MTERKNIKASFMNGSARILLSFFFSFFFSRFTSGSSRMHTTVRHFSPSLFRGIQRLYAHIHLGNPNVYSCTHVSRTRTTQKQIYFFFFSQPSRISNFSWGVEQTSAIYYSGGKFFFLFIFSTTCVMQRRDMFKLFTIF